MNVNDELYDALKVQTELLNRHNYSAYLMVTLTGNKACVDASGIFSDLFKGLFEVSCSNPQIKSLVMATAEALRGWEKSQEEKKGTIGATEA